jgi:hypothetical protein
MFPGPIGLGLRSRNSDKTVNDSSLESFPSTSQPYQSQITTIIRLWFIGCISGQIIRCEPIGPRPNRFVRLHGMIVLTPEPASDVAAVCITAKAILLPGWQRPAGARSLPLTGLKEDCHYLYVCLPGDACSREYIHYREEPSTLVWSVRGIDQKLRIISLLQHEARSYTHLFGCQCGARSCIRVASLDLRHN